MYVTSDAIHTCRKFEPIREYVIERFNGSRAVRRPNGHIDVDLESMSHGHVHHEHMSYGGEDGNMDHKYMQNEHLDHEND